MIQESGRHITYLKYILTDNKNPDKDILSLINKIDEPSKEILRLKNKIMNW